MEIISQLYLNMIIAGHVESGKSTMLKTIFASRSPEKIAICIETSPESFLKKIFLIDSYMTCIPLMEILKM